MITLSCLNLNPLGWENNTLTEQAPWVGRLPRHPKDTRYAAGRATPGDAGNMVHRSVGKEVYDGKKQANEQNKASQQTNEQTKKSQAVRKLQAQLEMFVILFKVGF